MLFTWNPFTSFYTFYSNFWYIKIFIKFLIHSFNKQFYGFFRYSNFQDVDELPESVLHCIDVIKNKSKTVEELILQDLEDPDVLSKYSFYLLGR